MERIKFRHKNETYLVTGSYGEAPNDKGYDIFTGKKENGRKTIKVKLDRYNGQTIEIR